MIRVALAFLLLTSPTAQEVHVKTAARGCYGGEERELTWLRTGDEFALGEHRLPASTVEGIRRVVLGARTGPLDPNAALASVGISPGSLREHRDEIVAAALPPTWKTRDGLARHLAPLLTWEGLHGPMLDELMGRNWCSTTRRQLEVTLPGEPRLTLRSTGLVPWMLPWEVHLGDRAWTSRDVAISQALVPLLPEGAPNAELLDGEDYWRSGFWNDEGFWDRWLGANLDASFAANEYVALEGFRRATSLLRVDKVMTGPINGQPLSMYFLLSARHRSPIDKLRWWNPIEDDHPTYDWHDLLWAWRTASLALEREAWIGAWKRAGPARTVGLEVVGALGTRETMLETLVMPAWKAAGLDGEPNFELFFRRDKRVCATVFLSGRHAGALITHATPGDGDHPLDRLDFSFHPRGAPPTYARVDAEGRLEVRTLR